ncbi:MAG: class I SAM-dependent methyltransferase [Candidatus Diapherotrites archaeon]|uniref:Class I SAM-dependent methyltransferase n=1 Tax=Candidatus Iainarchaeum sp. TaxID=3101447 RepID=A0A8T4L536_9ARCH|nr:class I SAM-dependent methyltransferase [Candidatus Diapherotrites archaeon]
MTSKLLARFKTKQPVQRARLKVNWFSRIGAPLLRVTILGSPAIHLRLRRLADLKPGQKVLELAAGPVPYHRFWESKLGPEGQLVVSDIDSGIMRASKRLSSKPKFRKTPRKSFAAIDLNRLPIDSDVLDRIVLISPFGFAHSSQGFKESFRALKPGGKVVLFHLAEFIDEGMPIPTKPSKENENRAKSVGFEIVKSGLFFSPYPHQYLVAKKPG